MSALAGQSFGEDPADDGRVVDNQDAYFSVAGHVRVSIRIAAVSVPLPVSTVYRVALPATVRANLADDIWHDLRCAQTERGAAFDPARAPPRRSCWPARSVTSVTLLRT